MTTPRKSPHAAALDSLRQAASEPIENNYATIEPQLKRFTKLITASIQRITGNFGSFTNHPSWRRGEGQTREAAKFTQEVDTQRDTIRSLDLDNITLSDLKKKLKELSQIDGSTGKALASVFRQLSDELSLLPPVMRRCLEICAALERALPPSVAEKNQELRRLIESARKQCKAGESTISTEQEEIREKLDHNASSAAGILLVLQQQIKQQEEKTRRAIDGVRQLFVEKQQEEDRLILAVREMLGRRQQKTGVDVTDIKVIVDGLNTDRAEWKRKEFSGHLSIADCQTYSQRINNLMERLEGATASL